MPLFKTGSPTLLSLLLSDGNASKYARAYVYRGSLLEIALNLAHVSLGRYTVSWTPATAEKYNVIFIVYDDAAYSVVSSMYERVEETWQSIDAIAPTIADVIWDELLAGHTITNSAGLAMQQILDLVNAINTGGGGYIGKSSFSYNPTTDTLTGLAWVERSNLVVAVPTSLSLTLYDAAGVALFTLTDNSPDAQGFFTVTKVNPGLSSDTSYYAVSTVTIGSVTVMFGKGAFTVG